MDVASPITKLLPEDDGSEATFVGHIDPVVQAVDGQIERVLRVGNSKPCQHRLAHVSLAVSVSVLQVKEIRGGRDENAFFPTHHTRGQDQSVGKDAALVGQTVAILVEEMVFPRFCGHRKKSCSPLQGCALELGGVKVAQGRVAALSIVKDFYIFE